MKKLIALILCAALALSCAAALAEAAPEKEEIVTINMNGAFALKGLLPEGYKWTLNSDSTSEQMLGMFSTDDLTRPVLQLSIALDDSYGGVDVDITRAERNALNGMVASKKENIQAQANSGLLSQIIIEMLAKEYYLDEYGPKTHLNGLQAVGFGWLQYDSVYNCCLREVKVIANLFESVSKQINEKVVFYTNDTDYPKNPRNRRVVNLDDISPEDLEFLLDTVNPIFQMSYHNLTEEEIIRISSTLARVAYAGRRQGVDIFDSLEYAIFPLEAKNEYDYVAGTKGHLVDYAANSAAMKEFLYKAD